MKTELQAPSAAGAGVFYAGAAYSFAELRRRGFSGSALRAMQRGGLRCRRCGKGKLVLGADLLAFFESLPVESLNGAG